METDPINRYARQTILPEIGLDGQKKLSAASILCVGAGGLGSPALLYLTAAGIGKIGIIDHDTIDISNLQRQVLFETNQVGQSKAAVAKTHLSKLNPDTVIECYAEKLNDKNIQTLFESYDIILDGTDNFETKFLINDAAVKFKKPWIYGAIQGFDGQVSVFDSTMGACYRCLYPEKPKTHIASCAESGVIGAVAGLTGTTQALQAIQFITAHKNFTPLIGKLWLIDSRTMATKTLSIPRNPDCPVCAHAPDEIILKYTSPVCDFTPEITPQQSKTIKKPLFIDVREKKEWEQGHIESALHCPLSSLMEGKIPTIQPDRDIILYCQKGYRSLQAAQILKQHGYPDSYNLSGGYDAWLKEE